MRTVLKIVLALLVIRLPALSAGQAAWVLVVNKSNHIDRLSTSKVKIVFLRNISRWPWGAEIFPIDLPDTDPARKEFLKVVMDSTPDQMDVYWIDQKVSRSLDRPVRASTAKQAKALVANHPGAIAYIPANDVDDSVRVLALK
jgi:ABC-type phosphate transport system substrate-binding protein